MSDGSAMRSPQLAGPGAVQYNSCMAELPCVQPPCLACRSCDCAHDAANAHVATRSGCSQGKGHTTLHMLALSQCTEERDSLRAGTGLGNVSCHRLHLCPQGYLLAIRWHSRRWHAPHKRDNHMATRTRRAPLGLGKRRSALHDPVVAWLLTLVRPSQRRIRPALANPPAVVCGMTRLRAQSVLV